MQFRAENRPPPNIPYLSLIVKNDALERLEINDVELATELLNTNECYYGTGLVIYGPFFGAEALEVAILTLTNKGMEYWDDFFDFQVDVPDWAVLSVTSSHPL